MSILRRGIPAVLLGMLLCLIFCIGLSSAAWADGSNVSDLQAAVERGDKSFTLTGDISLPTGVTVISSTTKIIVPEGMTLSMDGGILDASALRLAGGKIVIGDKTIFRVNDKFEYNGGTVEVVGGGFNLFPAEDILPNNTGIFNYPAGAGKTILYFKPTNDSEFAAAVASINALTDNFVANVAVHKDFTLTGMHVLNHQTNLSVFATLTLASGAQLVYDNCGGNVNVGDFENATQVGTIINNGALLPKVINVAAGSLLRSTGITETDELRVGNERSPGGDVEINGVRFLVRNKLNTSGGTVKVYKGFTLFPAADVLPDTGVITYPNRPVETNLSFKPTNDSEFAAAVTSINGMADHFVGNINVQKNIELTSKNTLTHKTFLYVNAGLKLASGAELIYDNCAGSVSLQNPNPNGRGGAIDNKGVVLVNSISLMPGCLLRSSGIMETSELRFGSEESAGGEVIVDGGVFRVNRKLLCSGGTITISGECFNAFPAADVLAMPDYREVFLYPNGDIPTSLLFTPSNDSEAMAALETANGLDDLFTADININFNWRITGDAVLSHKAELRIDGGRGGRLTVEEGASFTKTGGGNLNLNNNGNTDCNAYVKVRGKMTVGNLEIDPGCALQLEDTGLLTAGKLTVKGRFSHNGTLALLQKLATNPEPRLIMENGSVYEYGDGLIYVMDKENLDSYFANFDTGSFEKTALDKGTLYAPFAVDLVLPAKLSSIEEEAFAEDGFITVYIPAGVKTVDDSAFAGIDGLCVVGHSGTEAQRFAAENGFEFIALS